MKFSRPFKRFRTLTVLVAVGMVAAAGLLLVVGPTFASGRSPLHPVFPLLDADGQKVADTSNPVSTITTCGTCHDTDFIAEHNAHAGRLVGSLKAPAGEAVVVDIETNELISIEGAEEVVELNCFLCHTADSNNDARLEALLNGRFDWVDTATLVGSGIVEQVGDDYQWNPEAFDQDGNLLPDYVRIQDPSVENCGQCHGVATTDAVTPLALHTCGTEQRTTITTGQIFSPQRIADSGLNISGKDDLSRTWDVHAERLVGCTDCHYALNNPAYATEPGESRPDHLVFDPRRLEPGEYLIRPLHELARTEADYVTEGTCKSCHEVKVTHQWLPHTDHHMDALACETCHVARLESPARQMVDWTVLSANGASQFACRGHRPDDPEGQLLIVGYEPVILPRDDGDGTASLAPHNVITTWYWAYGEDSQPVALADLRAAYFDGEGYHPDVIAAFDQNGDGDLDQTELIIDTDAKEALIAGRLEALGLDSPHITAKIEAYPINHSVTHGEWATRDCRTCHGPDSRLAQPFELAGNIPGGVLPAFDADPAMQSGEIVAGEDGELYFKSNIGAEGAPTYVFGYSRSQVVDLVGALVFLGTVLGATVHGGMRYVAARRRVNRAPELREVYMYTVYERLWHWLQTAVILLLIFTGLVIHKPDIFGMFGFRWVVLVHNVMAAILVVNAALAAFYHLASGEIKQFLPRPRGFFNQSIEQALFYTRGIFKDEHHPFEKTPQRKLNPLQQVTYLVILNVLLPAQIITGALMWGVQRWPDVAARLGGLPFLALLHTLVAWLFASFIVMHVYLTTTGHKPLAAINGMIMGWDQVEARAGAD